MKIWNKIKNTFYDAEYAIGYRITKGYYDNLLGNEPSYKFNILKGNMKFWYADPILFNYHNKNYAFMEVYDRFKLKGCIGISEFDNKGRMRKPRIIIKENFHLSFPMVFSLYDNVYMLPECSESKQIRLYKMGKNLYDWKLEKKWDTPYSIVDICVLQNKKDCYLLVCEQDKNNILQTRIGIAKINCIDNVVEIGEIEFASEYSYEMRNGGAIIEFEGIVYRVVQISNEREYGKAFEIRMIEEFSSTNISEKVVKRIEKQDIHFINNSFFNKVVGTHTYGLHNKVEIIDVYMETYNIFNLLRKMIKRNKNDKKE